MSDIKERLKRLSERWGDLSLAPAALAEIERLRSELAEYKRIWEDGVPDNPKCRALIAAGDKAADIIDELRAEIAAKDVALHRISLGSQNSGTSKEDLGREARAALKPEETKETKE